VGTGEVRNLTIRPLAGTKRRRRERMVWYARQIALAAVAVLLVAGCSGNGGDGGSGAADATENPVVVLSTTLGDIKIELYPDKAPVTVENFRGYVKSKFYDGTIFHRVIPNFMIQGGGFDAEMKQKKTEPPIKNEAGNGLKNTRGTISMARTSVVDSATSQFFINVKDNTALDHRDETPRGFGYAVFGSVIEGMDVVDKIVSVATVQRAGHRDVPNEPVVITSAKVAE